MKRWYRAGIIMTAGFFVSTACYAQVINDNLIVDGSECIGFDCDTGESFSYDTLRLKENNTRITLIDTSSSGPSSDWFIRANDSNPDGASYFGIGELFTNTNTDPSIFRIDAGAPELSLHIDSAGNLNLTSGTARITNLADPINSLDAVNLRTLDWIVSTKITPNWLSSTSQVNATTSGIGSTALGAGASAKSYDTAIGYRATVTADGSTAVGANSTINAPNSVAIGADSRVESGANGGVAIGQNARVESGATNSVALGKDSEATEPNTVSIGSPGSEKRITNVADGINQTDAVNKRQLNVVSTRVNINTENIAINSELINQNTENMVLNRREINRLQNDLEDAYAGVAAAASLVTLTPSSPGKTTVNLGGAEYKGQYGIGFSAAHRLNSAILGDDIYFNGGISIAGGNTLTRIGGSWEF